MRRRALGGARSGPFRLTERGGFAGAGLSQQPVPSPSGPSETPNPHGNVSGQYHTMHELWDLANALSYQVGELQLSVICAHGKQWDGHFDPVSQAWVPPSNPDVQTWLDNYYAAYSNFGNVLDRANSAIKATISAGILIGGLAGDNYWNVAEATDTDGSVFDALVAAFEPFDDLDRRLRRADLGFPRECMPKYPNVPQPTAPDFSLDAYKLTNAIIKPLEGAGRGLRDFFNSTPFLLSMTAVIVVAGAYVAVQVIPRKR